MMQPSKSRWRLKGPEMEGVLARWYATVRSAELEWLRRTIAELEAGTLEWPRMLEMQERPMS